MNDDEQNAQILINEFLALLDQRAWIEKELILSIDIDEKIRLLTHKDEVDSKLGELELKVQDLPEIKNTKRIVKNINAVDVGTITLGDTAPKDSHVLRTWWQNILRKFGKYPCYAVFLLLPSDKETIKYLSKYGKELDLLSGKECLVLAFGKTNFKGPIFDRGAWSTAVDEHVSEGISVTLAKILNIEFTQFPCLIVFKDIRSSEHVVINLKDFEAENVAKLMRQVFWIINKAISKEQDPVRALSLLHKTETFQKTSLSIASELRSFAGKTLDTAMEAFIKASIQ